MLLKFIIIWGNNIDFDTLNYKVIAKGRTNYINNGLEAYGTDLDYDLLKEEGKFTKEFYGKVPSNGIELSGNLVEFKNENGKTIYYKKMNGHKLTPQQLTYNQITKGLNYSIKVTIKEGE